MLLASLRNPFAVRPLNAWGKHGEPIMTESATYDKAKVLYPF